MVSRVSPSRTSVNALSAMVAVDSDPRSIIGRFDNAALDDSVLRVGRDPQRKLGYADRLVGAATLAEEAGIRPERLALATAAALCFEHAGDPSSAGVHDVLKRVSRLDGTEGFGRSVAMLWSRLSTGRMSENHLISLERLVWAWSATEAGFTGRQAQVER